jgi:hypothetical protein
MPWLRVAVLAVLSSLWLRAAHGQPQKQSEPPTSPDSMQNEISTRVADTAIKVQVNLVLVRVVVKDADEKLVPSLNQEDFQVFDNGKRQKISTFSVETPGKPRQQKQRKTQKARW